jgi:hypothetical protein
VDNSATEYKNLNVNLPFIKLLRQLSNELPIKRPYEFAILEYLLENEHLDFERAKSVVSKYISRIDEDTLHHSFRFLTGSFDDANDQRVKLPILQLVGSRLIRLEPFNELLSDEKTKEALADIIRFALLRYEEEFGNEDYGMPFFKLYRSYNARNMALLSNYDKKHGAFYGSGLLGFKNDRFLIVELHKDENIEDRIKYKDKFISSSIFQWQSPNTTRQNSETGRNLTQNTSRGVNLHLFVRKIKDIDRIRQPFIYIGKGDCIECEGEQPITLQLKLQNTIPPALYEELNSQIVIPS